MDANEDLPRAIRSHLATHAQEIFRAAFNSAWKNLWVAASRSWREQLAHPRRLGGGEAALPKARRRLAADRARTAVQATSSR
jgi:hypothetical protein